MQMYLRNNKASALPGAMFVHYKTISYRLENKQISGINFDNANEVLAVSNGYDYL